MKRLVVIFAVFVVSLASAGAFAAYWWWGEALSTGKSLYSVRLLEKRAKRAAPRLPLAAWVGDSTIISGTSGIRVYPQVIWQRLKGARRPYESIVLAHAGIGPFVEYCAVGSLVGQKPRALYIIANISALTRSGKEQGVLEIASSIPRDELLRAAFLPWHDAGITIPRLYLARALSWSAVQSPFYFAEGLRQMFRDELYAERKPRKMRDFARRNRRDSKRLSKPIDESSPQVVMLKAAVELAVRNGIRTTVIFTPISKLGFDLNENAAAVFAERAEMLRGVVESAGGRFLDLHNALAWHMFRDHGGHFTREGTKQMVLLLERYVRADVFAPAGR